MIERVAVQLVADRASFRRVENLIQGIGGSVDLDIGGAAGSNPSAARENRSRWSIWCGVGLMVTVTAIKVGRDAECGLTGLLVKVRVRDDGQVSSAALFAI